MPKKRKAGLPRVTLLAYSKRDLVAFVSAVESLRLLIEDLRAVAADLRSAAGSKGKPKAAPMRGPVKAALSAEQLDKLRSDDDAGNK